MSYPMQSHTETTKPHVWKHLLPFNLKCRACSTASGNILLQSAPLTAWGIICIIGAEVFDISHCDRKDTSGQIIACCAQL